jgi:acyl-CoA thioester hydrolase
MENQHTDSENRPKFQAKIVVKPGDIDELGHVNNVVYLQWVQQVATAHWEAMTSGEMRNQNLWVVLRHEIDYFNPAFLGDDITGSTWVSSATGAQSIRHVLFTVGEKKLAESKTNWCLLDSRTMKPKRIGQEIKSLLEK